MIYFVVFKTKYSYSNNTHHNINTVMTLEFLREYRVDAIIMISAGFCALILYT